MAISHIGRLLRDWADKQVVLLGQNALQGSPKDFSDLRYLQGTADGIKLTLERLEEIESEGS